VLRPFESLAAERTRALVPAPGDRARARPGDGGRPGNGV